jgi:hypothetical protein
MYIMARYVMMCTSSTRFYNALNTSQSYKYGVLRRETKVEVKIRVQGEGERHCIPCPIFLSSTLLTLITKNPTFDLMQVAGKVCKRTNDQQNDPTPFPL